MASSTAAAASAAAATSLKQSLVSIVKSSPNLGVGTVVSRWPRLTRQCFVITAVRPKKGEESHPVIYGVYSPPLRGRDSLPVTRGERVSGPLKRDWLVVQPAAAAAGALPAVQRSAQKLELGGELRQQAHSLTGPFNPNRLRRVMYKAFKADPRYGALLAAREKEQLLRQRAARAAAAVRRVGKDKFVRCEACSVDFKATPAFFAEEVRSATAARPSLPQHTLLNPQAPAFQQRAHTQGWEDRLVCEACAIKVAAASAAGGASGKGAEAARGDVAAAAEAPPPPPPAAPPLQQPQDEKLA
jgi:hypothetical protein